MGYRKERKCEREPDPILKLRRARLKAIMVREQEAAERDGKKFAPKLSVWWEILDDGKNGEHKGVRFWDNYSFVKSFEEESEYVIREGTRIGDLAAFVAYDLHDGADFFEEDVDINFAELEGEEVIAGLEPRKFKEEPATGTRTVSETLQLAERAEKVAAKAEAEEEENFQDIPF